MPSPLQQSRINGAIPVLSEQLILGSQSAVLISCRIIDPPPDHNHLTRGKTPSSVTRLNDNTSTGGVHTGAQHHPIAIRTTMMSSPKHERHDWLMNDSD